MAPDPWRVAGPDALGRALVAAPGQDVPTPWAMAARLRVDDAVVADPAKAVGWLQARWSARHRYVVELAVTMGATKEPEADDRPAWELGARFEFWRERLHHLIWSNAVDGRKPDAPVWWWHRKAEAIGARAGVDADVELPDGRAAWIDGGPLTPFATDEPAGALVVPAIAVERGGLAPIGGAAPTADLAPDQLAAVAHRAGGARIVAPAGSGKTRVLTERARHLLADRKVPASAVCLVAFNVRAADEMRARTTDLSGLRIQTLNGLGLAILNGSGPFAVPRGRSGSTRVADERDVRGILARLVDLPRKTNTDPAAAWIDALAAVRLGLRPPAAVEAAFRGETDGLAAVVPRYREFLADHDLVDFDEQIAGAAEALAADPGARAAAQRACRVLLADEFQDLTPAHVLLIRLLAAPAFDVFGVGDDDQTIYGFNGASPEWLIGYPDLFPGAGSHALHVNYRCPPAVIRAASTLLQHNRDRLDKRIEPAPGRADDPEGLTVVLAGEPLTATVAVVTEAVAHTPPADIAVLARVNAALAPVQIALTVAGVPCRPVVDASFCERTGVRAALAWLRLASDPGRLQGDDLTETARRVNRRPSPKAVEWIAEKRSLSALRTWASRFDDQRVSSFVAALEAVVAASRVSTAEALAEIREHTGLGSAMDALDTAGVGRNKGGHGDDLDALAALAPLQPDATRFEPWLRAALSDKGGRQVSDGLVTLSTIHRVKGQEWPVVIVHDAAADQFPHRLADDVEEERRVFHVAITRAQRRAVVVAPSDEPSPFIAQMARPPQPGRPALVERDRRRSAPRPSDGGRAAVEPRPEDAKLVDELKRWRNQARDGKPAYTVLTNESLLWIARRRPTSLVTLAQCPGIGPAKIERFGADLLALIDGFVD